MIIRLTDDPNILIKKIINNPDFSLYKEKAILMVKAIDLYVKENNKEMPHDLFILTEYINKVIQSENKE
jgi:hypothetical protein